MSDLETLHVHFYGSPGVGKSVIAASVFAALKKAGVNCELVQEYAKELVFAGTLDPATQIVTSAEQLRREVALRGKVRVLVSDSPPILGGVYAPDISYGRALEKCIGHAMRDWARLSFLVSRPSMVRSYEQAGRKETAAQSLALQAAVKDLLKRNDIAHESVVMQTDPAEIDRVARIVVGQVMQNLENAVKSASEPAAEIGAVA